MLELNLMKGINKEKKYESIHIEEISSKEIAVIGISMKLPKAENIHEFWYNLEKSVDCITGFPEDRKKNIDGFLKYMDLYGSRPEYDIGSYLDEIDKFDYEYFKISPKEASLMDPNQRIFLQTAMEALEDAGYADDKLNGSKVGVYLGFHETLYNYRQLIAKFDPASISLSLPGNLSSIIASRISYFLNLTGPSLIIDTACSSSLVAVHLACQGIKSGDCEMAIAGGVRINLLPVKRDFRFGVESATGRSRAFDESADGISSGEGVAAIILKPLSKALIDKDNIYAVIKGTAVNQDGSSVGITAPNVAAQEEVIVRAWKDAGVNPEDIGYIETHGTGTKIGDPIEIEGIQRAFKRYTDKKQFCAIGSLKTNLGHLDNAAGIAGFIKAVLQLKHKKIAPILHFNRPNTRIAFEESPLYVNDRLSLWETSGNRRICGVSSFGLSGTNCHVVLEEAPETDSYATPVESENILTLTSMRPEGIAELLGTYIKLSDYHLSSDNSVIDMCYTANACRRKFNYRLAVIFSNMEDLKNKLQILACENPASFSAEWYFYGHVDGNDRMTKDGMNSAGEICMAFINGIYINWDDYYNRSFRRKMSLPVYSFKKSRCWLEMPADFIADNSSEMKNKIVLNLKDKGKKNISITGNENGVYTDMERAVAGIFGEILGYDQIDLNANIFDIGIDSILMVKISNAMNEMMNINIEVSRLLECDTIRDCAAYFEKNKKQVEEKKPEYESGAKKEAVYELSFQQKRLWILNKIDKKNIAYNTPGVYEIYGEIDRECFHMALKLVIERHEELRAIFVEEDGMPLHKIMENPEPVVDYLDLTEDPCLENGVHGLINDLMNTVFDLSKWPLMKINIVKIGHDKSLLMFNMHHIISDGWSFAVFIKEILVIYEGVKNKMQPKLNGLDKQYRDYVAGQKVMLDSQDLKKQEKYWRESLKGNLPVLNLPVDCTRPAKKTYRGDEIKFFIKENVSLKIRDFCRINNITPNVFFFSAYYLTLAKYTGGDDIIIGSIVNGRKKRDLELIIGNFINYLPVRMASKGGETVMEFIMNMKQRLYEAHSNQDYPFELLIDLLELKTDPSHNPIYDTMFIYHSKYFLQDQYDIAGLRLKYVEIGENKSVLDLKLDVFEYDDTTFIGKMQYSLDLFREDTIKDMVGKFNVMINMILENPDKRNDQCEIMTAEEKLKLENKRRNIDLLKNQEEYWLNAFKYEVPALNLPLDHQIISGRTYEKNSLNVKLDNMLEGKMRDLSKKSGVTLFSAYLSAYNILLSKYTGQEDVMVGIPVNGIDANGKEFPNILAMRNYPLSGKTVEEFLNDVERNSHGVFDNRNFGIKEFSGSVLKRSDGERVFDAMFAFNSMVVETGIRTAGYDKHISDNKLFECFMKLIVDDHNGGISLTFEYAPGVFEKRTVESFAGHYANVMSSMTETSSKKIGELEILDPEEKERILTGFNQTRLDYPIDATVHGLFANQAAKNPGKTALIFDHRHMSYGTLNERSNVLANALRKNGAGRDSIVGIMVNRSFEMIIGIMGILKSGAAYLPIDPDYPEDRIKYMLKDSNSKILVTSREMKIHDDDITRIFMEDMDHADPAETADPGYVNKPTDLSYVIYTSGSTGKPKGVMIEHGSVVNFIFGIPQIIELHDNILNLTTISFDIFVLETLLPLCMGMKVVISGEKAQRDPEELCRLIKENDVKTLQITPSRLKMVLDYEECGEYLGKVKTIMIGGETFPEFLLDRIKSVSDAKIYNMYGPTETTVWSTVKEIKEDEKISIGKPISNTQILIFDNSLKPVPVGVAGDLFIAGRGLSRGYLNKAELTGEKFITNPYMPGGKMYRTGDMAKWLPDGNIEFLGRSDNQVKIRGYRIELGEIENRLMKHEFINEAVVIPKGDDVRDKFLCAYIVSEKNTDPSELRNFLSRELPEYMIPSYFIQIDRMPQTPNGKIDRKALPDIDAGQSAGVVYEPPSNGIEACLVEISKQVFMIESIGINDNFFDLGGNSLNGARFISLIHKKLNAEVSINEIFIYPTIKSLAKRLSEKGKSYSSILHQEEYGPVSDEKKNAGKGKNGMLENETDEMKLINSPDKDIGNLNKKSLKKLYFKYPDITVDQTYAILWGILNKDGSYPWLLNYFVQMQGFSHYKTGYLIFDEAEVSWNNCPALGFQIMDRDAYKIFARSISPVEMITDYIDKGYYVYSMFDQFYNPNTDYFQKRHFTHYTLIYGYDTDKRKIHVADFYDMSKYDITKTIDFDSFDSGFDFDVDMIENKNWLQYRSTRVKFELGSNIILLKPNGCRYTFDNRLFFNQLSDFVNSTDTVQRYEERLERKNRGIIYGIGNYKYLRDCMGYMKKERKFSWNSTKAFHLIYDRTKAMLLRLEYLMKNDLIVEGQGTADEYVKIMKLTEHARNIMISFVIKKGKDPSLLDRVMDNLDEIYECEERAVRDMMKKLVINDASFYGSFHELETHRFENEAIDI